MASRQYRSGLRTRCCVSKDAGYDVAHKAGERELGEYADLCSKWIFGWHQLERQYWTAGFSPGNPVFQRNYFRILTGRRAGALLTSAMIEAKRGIRAMRSRSRVPVFVAAISFLIGCASPAIAQESRWGSPDEEVVRFMIAAAEKWSAAQCSPQEGLQDVIADDFQGTFTSGQRFGKAEAVTTDTAKARLSRDCQIGEVKVRFFGDSLAIAYGAESRMRKDLDGNEAKRCLVWTDTWLKRNARWQIVAAQDTVVACPH